MSYPIVHSLIGYSVYRAAKPKKRSWKKAVFFSLLAVAADLDFIPGILVGRPFLFHQSVTHSIGAAFLCAAAIALGARVFTKYTFWKTFLLSFAIYFSHPLLDFFTSPGGPILWPFEPSSLAKQIEIFRSLPLQCDGAKDFACVIFSNVSRVQRFWREILCLGGVALFCSFRWLVRKYPAPAERYPCLTSDAVPS